MPASGLTYPDAIDRLLSLVDHERRSTPAGPRQKRIYDLRSIARLLRRMGSPHQRPGSVHITGTKGKGSTAAMVESILRAAGHSTGFFSSPHLHSFCERIRCDGEPISPQTFADLVAAVWPYHRANAADPGAGPATLFEFLTAMAFRHFQQQQTDTSVIEVGLGGRLDATNVVQPAVSVITPVSLDHMAILGNTIGAIAADKAGIIKPDIPVVIAPQQFEPADGVIRAVAASRRAPAVRVADAVRWRIRERHDYGIDMSIHTHRADYPVRLPLLGDFQAANAATAVATAEMLDAEGFPISRRAVTFGLNGVEWPGRLEVLRHNPPIVADGAHNDHSLDTALSTLSDYLPHRRLIAVAGFSRDKQVAAMAGLLAQRADRIIAVRSRHPRSLSADDTAAAFRDAGMPANRVAAAADVAAGIAKALDIADADDLILATGSLFVAAEAREAILELNPEIYPDLTPALP